jgi:hypothetical protein
VENATVLKRKRIFDKSRAKESMAFSLLFLVLNLGILGFVFSGNDEGEFVPAPRAVSRSRSDTLQLAKPGR